MKKLRLVLLTLFAFALSNCDIKVQKTTAQTSSTGDYNKQLGNSRMSMGMYTRVGVYTDKLGCTWFYILAGASDGGVEAKHHPTCVNPGHNRTPL